jgi:biopolymer transport protein ExbD
MQELELDEPGMDISSLIDVCFLLLIYFLVTTQIVRKEQELSTELPAVAPTDTPPTLSPLFIILEANGNISLKDETGQVELIESDPDSRELPSLAKRLSIHKGAADISGDKALVQIKVDGDAVQQRVTDILNALAGAKIKDITFTDLIDPEVE